jgi:SAM-dependent methyltransferase
MMLIGTIERVSAGLSRRVDTLANRGDAVFCPICGRSFACFKDDWNRPELCWGCGAHERHRALALLLRQRPGLLEQSRSVLHFAPEWCVRQLVDPERRYGHHYRYLTTDLDQPGVDLHLDITDMAAVGDGEFDAVICSHVLEHVPDDRVGMSELRRITSEAGCCLVMVPLDPARSSTYEDWSITNPDERERAFWQHDHVRVYGLDVRDRLTDAGFMVECVVPETEFSDSMERCRLLASDLIWICRPVRTETPG